MESCLSFGIREMQVRTAVRSCFTPTGISTVSVREVTDVGRQGCEGIRPSHIAGENVRWHATWGKRFDGSSTYNYRKTREVLLELKTGVQTESRTQMLVAAAERCKQPTRPSVDEEMPSCMCASTGCSSQKGTEHWRVDNVVGPQEHAAWKEPETQGKYPK